MPLGHFLCPAAVAARCWGFCSGAAAAAVIGGDKPVLCAWSICCADSRIAFHELSVLVAFFMTSLTRPVGGAGVVRLRPCPPPGEANRFLGSVRGSCFAALRWRSALLRRGCDVAAAVGVSTRTIGLLLRGLLRSSEPISAIGRTSSPTFRVRHFFLELSGVVGGGVIIAMGETLSTGGIRPLSVPLRRILRRSAEDTRSNTALMCLCVCFLDSVAALQLILTRQQSIFAEEPRGRTVQSITCQPLLMFKGWESEQGAEGRGGGAGREDASHRIKPPKADSLPLPHTIQSKSQPRSPLPVVEPKGLAHIGSRDVRKTFHSAALDGSKSLRFGGLSGHLRRPQGLLAARR